MTACISAYTRVSRRSKADVEIQVLYVQHDENSPVEPFAPLVQYFVESDAVSRIPWQQDVCFSVGLLLDFVAATGLASVSALTRDGLRALAEYLVEGTARASSEAVRALRWEPRSVHRAARILSLITDFTDWLSNRTGSASANPWRDATPREHPAAASHRRKKSAHAFLRHAASRRREELETSRVRSVRVPGGRDRVVGEIKAFDAKMFPKLLMEGFGRRAPPGAPLARKLRLRDALIMLLLHGGGLRVSEVFHLWVGDVTVDPGIAGGPPTAIVWLYHPRRGAAPVLDGKRWRDREECLREQWKMKPRNVVRGRFHAGWKNLALTDTRRQCARVEWFPSYWGEVFLALYRAYLDHRPPGNHPFLFVSERKGHRGEPYTIAAFEQTLARSVRRIGLVPAKGLGSSPHGHRHAFGLALAEAQLDPLVIQEAFHHRSVESQLVYTKPGAEKINQALREATERVWQMPPALAKDIQP